MITIAKNIALFGAGLVVALASGTPALADDTELLLLNPDELTAPKPNIMFILDTSGSMTTVENTREIYDSALAFHRHLQPRHVVLDGSRRAAEL